MRSEREKMVKTEQMREVEELRSDRQGNDKGERRKDYRKKKTHRGK